MYTYIYIYIEAGPLCYSGGTLKVHNLVFQEVLTTSNLIFLNCTDQLFSAPLEDLNRERCSELFRIVPNSGQWPGISKLIILGSAGVLLGRLPNCSELFQILWSEPKMLKPLYL